MDRYPALALLVRIASIIAWAIAGVFALAGLAAIGRGAPGVLAALMLWAAGALLWVYIKASAEVIQVFVRIEENTRPRA